MKTSANGRKFIQKEEGVILYAYDDKTGKRVNPGDKVYGTITIGVGHTSAAGGVRVTPGMIISASQADSILAGDLSSVERDIERLVKVPLNQNQFDALASMMFNIGSTQFSRSTTLRKLNAGDYKGAADAILGWSKANGNPTLLLPRRQRERALFLTPVNKAGSVTGGVVTGTVVATGGTIAVTPVNYWPWVIGIGISVAIVALIGYTIYKFRNGNKNASANQITLG